MIECVEDHENIIANEALDQQFGPLGAEPVDDVLEKNEHVHVTRGLDRKKKASISFLERHHQVSRHCDVWPVVGTT